jgi:hypothetical protein
VLRHLPAAFVPGRFELRAIGDLPPPCLATGEGSRAGRLPKHRDTPLGSRTDAVPLPPAEMTRDRFQIDPLVQIAELQTKPAASVIRHIGGDFAGRNFLIQIAIIQADHSDPFRTRSDKFCRMSPFRSNFSSSSKRTRLRGRDILIPPNYFGAEILQPKMGPHRHRPFAASCQGGRHRGRLCIIGTGDER